MRQSVNPGEMKNNEQKNATTQALEATVRYNGIGKTGASYDRLCVDFQRSYVDFDNAESYTFAAPEGACYTIADAVFSIAIEGSVTINKDQGFYLAKGTSVNAEGNVVVMGTADKNGNSFTVETITLTNAYNAGLSRRYRCFEDRSEVLSGCNDAYGNSCTDDHQRNQRCVGCMDDGLEWLRSEFRRSSCRDDLRGAARRFEDFRGYPH